MATLSNALLPLALFATPIAGQGSVWVVDDDAGPGVDFAEIQAAIDAAADGDGILVRAGAYDGFTVQAKTLTIIGEEGAAVELVAAPFKPMPAVQVQFLDASQSLTWIGLDVTLLPGAFGGHSALYVQGNSGPVWFEDVTFTGTTAMTAVINDSLVFSRCRLEGSGSSALVTSNTRTYVFDSEFVGADGSGGANPFQPCQNGVDGGRGIEVLHGFLFASGSRMLGGDGGDGTAPPGQWDGNGSNGGDALAVLAGAPALELLDNELLPGTGAPGGAACADGVDGSPVSIGGGALVLQPGVARGVESTTPVREGETAVFTFTGAPGDVVLGMASLGTSALTLPALVGPLLPSVPFTLTSIGALPASGSLDVGLVIAPMPPALETRTVFVQALVGSPAGVAYAGASTALVVLDAAL